MMFNRATAASDRSLRQGNNVYNDDDDNLDSDEEDDSSDDNIDRGCDSDEDSEDEILMNQFDWIEEDQQQQHHQPQQQQQQDGTSAQRQQQPRPQELQRPALTKKQHSNNSDQAQRQTIVDLVSASFHSMTLSTPDHAMTQSEDFIQAMDSQGDLEVDADKITDLAQPSSVLSSISAHTITTTTTSITKITSSAIIEANADTDEFGGMGLASQEAGIATGKEEVMLWVMDAAPNPDVMIVTQTDQALELLVDDSTPVLSEKPKKKAHRSKRGGRNQREKQLNKQQFIVGHDDDGPMYLEDLSDEEDEDRLAMEDYLQNCMGSDNSEQFDTLLDSLKGLHNGGQGHSKSVGGKRADDSDYEQQLSELDSDDYEEDEFDFEEDYDDGIKKLDFSKVKESVNDKRKNRKADDLLREELRDLMPLWRSGALEDGDGSYRPFKPRAKGYAVYDDSDEEFMMGGGGGGGKKKKNKNKKEPHGGSFETLLDINRQIEDFVKDRTTDSLQLPPMPKPLRRKVHLLCNHYSLKSQSVGSGKRRFPILIKTDRTKMPLNPVNVNKLLNQSEKELTLLSAQFQGSRKGSNNNFGNNNNFGGKGGKKGGNGGGGGGFAKGKGKNGGGGGSMAAPHGTVVGASASAISVENLGHRMLSKMGWMPGVGLGASGDGITQPIEAIVRAKNRGLGHE